MKQKTAIIIGAGPAGLTAAYELLDKTDIKPIIFEMTDDIGGISKTVNYKGNRIDIGGHRFFSKSDRVMQWWQNILPLQEMPYVNGKNGNRAALNITYQNKKKLVNLKKNGADPSKTDDVMLIRNRLSRIFFLRKFFSYPVSLNINTVKNLGFVRMLKIGLSYLYIKFFPIKEEKSLEDFFINRFGGELYLTFFKDYTEKVWGVKCNQISPEWGAQRVKGLSITKALAHAFKQMASKDLSIEQKETETSLIEQFMYPKFGPGQMWEKTADIIKEKGGEIYKRHKIVGIRHEGKKITEIKVKDENNNEIKLQTGDYFFSTMPVKELIKDFEEEVPNGVREAANGLVYRDLIIVGLLLKKLKIKNETKIKTFNDLIPDNWIYIQEKEVRIGRLQIFNNWSPYLLKDPENVWIGLEYFCNEGSSFWDMSDEDFINFAINELIKIDLIEKESIIDSTIIRTKNAYPAYYGTYNKFDAVRNFTDQFENLFLIGRNGMHKYNNQDHSMLSAMIAVENIINEIKTKDNIWNVNVEQEYIEEKVVAT